MNSGYVADVRVLNSMVPNNIRSTTGNDLLISKSSRFAYFFPLLLDFSFTKTLIQFLIKRPDAVEKIEIKTVISESTFIQYQSTAEYQKYPRAS